MQNRPDDVPEPEPAQPDSAEVDDSSNVLKTWATPPRQRIAPPVRRDACLVQIYPTGPGMGTRHTLNEEPVVIGRDAECPVVIGDPSVSRRHAEIRAGMDGHYVIDLQSTNGTFVNEKRITLRPLKDGDYLRISNWIFRYLGGGNVEAEYHEEIYRLTIIDGLTGVHNKRYLLEFLDRELSRSARHDRPLSLAMIDIDRFKVINDQHGHLAGDYVLRELVGCVREAIRKEELFARYGGEEFALVLPETTAETARLTAERIRGLVEQHSFEYESKPFRVTISIGVTTTEGDTSITPTDLIRSADENLYRAKNAGRNCVICGFGDSINFAGDTTIHNP